jgi:hypothetical protein
MGFDPTNMMHLLKGGRRSILSYVIDIGVILEFR